MPHTINMEGARKNNEMPEERKKKKPILMGHGSGGKLMHALIRDYFLPAFGESELLDSARVEAGGARLAFTTDSYVVSPLFFPGGNIGELAVNGTVNDLSMVGAEPLYLTAGFIIEEGFELEDLRKVIASMSAAAGRAGVRLVSGDTKVVEKGKGDGLFINTAGIGLIAEGVDLSLGRVSPGDAVLVSAAVGSHGIAVMAGRNGLFFEPPLISDCRPLNGLVKRMLGRAGGGIKIMRDPTRGGLATTLKELAEGAGVCIRINEDAVPVSGAVRGACELLGLDPLYAACEGVLVAIAKPDMAEYLLEIIRAENASGNRSALIGRVEESPKGMVLLETSMGGERILDMLTGEQLPRIC